jgi:hypothetical protein
VNPEQEIQTEDEPTFPTGTIVLVLVVATLIVGVAVILLVQPITIFSNIVRII